MTERTCPYCGREVSPAAAHCPGCGHPLEPVAWTGARRSSNRAIWLLVAAGCGLVAIIFGGILAAIFVPNFLDALAKAKQKRTMADLRAWSVALEEYRVDHGGAVPEAGSLDALAGALDPSVASDLSRVDGWRNRIRYACWSEVPEVGGCDTYRLVSPGRDGDFEHEDPALYEPAALERNDYEADLVMSDGYFLRYPAPAR
jgi:type II secretory pathway pseudopilin PulG